MLLSATVLVALLLVGAERPSVQDLEFARGVERWVADVSGPHYRPESWLPMDVRALGAPHWRTRHVAERLLADVGPDRFRWLIMAERHPEAEVRWRARRLLEPLARCPYSHDPGPFGYVVCVHCAHTGDLRFEHRWDGEPVPRDLFTREAIFESRQRALARGLVVGPPAVEQ